MTDDREAKVQRLEEVYHTYAQIPDIKPWEQVRVWATDEGWGEEYPELEYELWDRLAPEMKKEWAKQLNDSYKKLKRPVSTRFFWQWLMLGRVRVRGEDGRLFSEVRPIGDTSIPNAMIFDPRLRDEDLRVYAVLRATSFLGIATVPIPFLQATLRVSEPTVQARLDNLRHAGYIRDLTPSQPGRPRSYRLFTG